MLMYIVYPENQNQNQNQNHNFGKFHCDQLLVINLLAAEPPGACQNTAVRWQHEYVRWGSALVTIA